MSQFYLKKVTKNDAEEFYTLFHEIGDGESGFEMKAPKNQEHYLEILDQIEKNCMEEQPIGRVPQELHALYVEDRAVGVVKFRTKLNEALLQKGGNIGYMIAKDFRRKGYATKMLELILEIAREKKLDKVLITANEGNVFSRKVIEKNSGVLENIVEGIARYWIFL